MGGRVVTLHLATDPQTHLKIRQHFRENYQTISKVSTII
jgi:hypothetical protein